MPETTLIARREVDTMYESIESLVKDAQRAQRLALAHYEAGLDHGYQLGYRTAEADHEAAWAAYAALARRTATTQAYDELCQQRGESERAERHRRFMRERGITP